MFEGVCVVFGDGFTSKREKIFAAQIQKAGGSVHTREKVPKMFRKRSPPGPLPATVTHVVVNSDTHITSVMAALQVDALPQNTKVVLASWIEKCIEAQSKLDEHPFQITSEQATISETHSPARKRVKSRHKDTQQSDTHTNEQSDTHTNELLDTHTNELLDTHTNELSDTHTNELLHTHTNELLHTHTNVTVGEWQTTVSDTCIYRIGNALPLESSSPKIRILGFDLDGTLINNSSGKAFPTSEDDWCMWHRTVPARLRSEYNPNTRLVIFTNQLGTGNGKGLSRQKLLSRLCKVTRHLVGEGSAAAIDVLAATGDDIYRKPRPGMWDLYMDQLAGVGVDVDREASCFVGDAAGRPAAPGHKKDHSDSDLKFALNLGIKFFTPEEFFIQGKGVGAGVQRTIDAGKGFDPTKLPPPLLPSADATEGDRDSIFRNAGTTPEIVLLVGPPASGKSTLTVTLFKAVTDVEEAARNSTYVRVNQDTLKTRQKCKAVALQALQRGLSVCVDNTNPNRESRADWVQLSKQQGARIRCVHVRTPKALCMHLNVFRGLGGGGPGSDQRRLPPVVIHSYFKNFEELRSDEGFDRIDEWQFTPLPFSSEKAKRLFYMHLT